MRVITERDALEVIDAVRKQYGWAVKVLMKEDAEVAVGRPLTDVEWSTVSQSDRWQALEVNIAECDEILIQTVVTAVLDAAVEAVFAPLQAV